MSCSSCIANSAGLEKLYEELMADPEFKPQLPISGSIELSLACNVRCRHCYILFPGATNNEMNTSQMKQVLDKLSDAGVIFLLLTGGEVLARPDFKELYLHAKQKGFVLSVYTNGTLIDEEMADYFSRYPPKQVEITIYGHTEETYEKVTNSRGSFKRFRRGVDLLLERGVKVELKTMVMKSNFHEFEQIREWALSKTGQFSADRDINPRLDGDHGVLAERLSVDEYAWLDRFDENFNQEYTKQVSQMMETGLGGVDDVFMCGAGVHTFHVDPRGQMFTCMLYREHGYDLLNQPVEGWADHLAKIRAQKTVKTACNSCSNNVACGRCAAASLLELNHPGKSVPYYCQITQERKKTIGRPKIFEIEVV